ncbi:MAG: efflux RND transporter periplasmic adaptor subunit [Anaerolineales bacterium]|nr:efflux RND transporter periplasmic adaptor subunit [Anaerolineales bacterium]
MRIKISMMRKWLPPTGGAILLLALILYMTGVFTSGKIRPGEKRAPDGLPEPSVKDQAKREMQPIWYEAVGTVQSRTRATVASQVTGRVIEVNVEAGASVKKGARLASLDNQEFKARLEQSRSALQAALAEREHADANHARIKKLLEQKAVTPEQMEAAVAGKKRADAGVVSAEQKVKEVQVTMSYTRIDSPMDGVLVKRQVEPGDLAWPGKPLFIIHDPEDLRLEANVREGLIGKIKKGQAVQVQLTALGKLVEGKVDEVIPSADPVSRSFLVKISLPNTEGLYPGMYGKLRISLGNRYTVLVPAKAVRHVGQLTTVQVFENGRWIRHYVTVGAKVGDRLEILSGLSGEEKIGWEEGGRHGSR